MRRYAIGLALMLLVVGLETTAHGEDALRQLISGEIRSLVNNGTLVRAVPCDPTASYHQEETIRSDGSFTVYADLADVTGKVSIERDMLCLTVGEKLVCRKILTNGHGRYWEELQVAPGEPLWRRQIEFLPVNTSLNCSK